MAGTGKTKAAHTKSRSHEGGQGDQDSSRDPPSASLRRTGGAKARKRRKCVQDNTDHGVGCVACHARESPQSYRDAGNYQQHPKCETPELRSSREPVERRDTSLRSARSWGWERGSTTEFTEGTEAGWRQTAAGDASRMLAVLVDKIVGSKMLPSPLTLANNINDTMLPWER